MKRTLCLLLALLTAALCTACREQDAAQALELTEEEAVEVWAAPAPISPDYAYGNMQKNAPAGDFMVYGNEILFLRNLEGRTLLYGIDRATGEVRPFCKDAACTHRSAKCVSAGVLANLEQYEGRLYALDSDWQIRELKGGSFERIAQGAVNHFWHAGGRLYAQTKDGSLVLWEKEGGKPKLLLDEYAAYCSVIYGQTLYGISTQRVTRVDLTAPEPRQETLVQGCSGAVVDGTHVYYTEEQSGYLYRCALDGSGKELLLAQAVLPASLNFDEDNLYFRLYGPDFFTGEDSLGHSLYRLSKADPADWVCLAQFPERIFQVYTVPGSPAVYVTAYGEETVYAVAKDGSGAEKLALPEY